MCVCVLKKKERRKNIEVEPSIIIFLHKTLRTQKEKKNTL